MAFFRDVAHLYLGCKCIVEEAGLLKDSDKQYVLLRKPYIGLEWQLFDERDNKWIVAFIDDVKPILRRLESMTIEEANNVGLNVVHVELQMFNRFWQPRDLIYLLSKGFDIFGLIDSGQAINAAAVKNNGD